MDCKGFIENLANHLQFHFPQYDVIVDDLEINFANVIKIMVFIETKRIMGNRFVTHIMVLLDIYNIDMLDIMSMGNNLFNVLEMLPYNNVLLKGYNYSFKAEGLPSSKKTFNSKQQKYILGNASICYDIFEYKKEQLPIMLRYEGVYKVNEN